MENFSNERPPLGDIKVGDKVIVVRPSPKGRSVVPIEANVAKVARSWIEIQRPGFTAMVWHMRLDTQDEGNKDYSYYNSRFLTPDQYAWEEKLRKSDATLRDAGISLHSSSPLGGPAERVRLAELVAHMRLVELSWQVHPEDGAR